MASVNHSGGRPVCSWVTTSLVSGRCRVVTEAVSSTVLTNRLGSHHRERQRTPRLEFEGRTLADLGDRHLRQFGCRSIGLSQLSGPFGVRAADLNPDMWVYGGGDRLQRPHGF